MRRTSRETAEKIEAAITYLLKVRFATAEQIYRVMQHKELTPSATVWTRVFKKAIDAGYILKTTPLLSKTLYYAAPHTEVLSDWSGMKAVPLERASVSLQAHSLAISSVLSRFLTAPEIDPIGAQETWHAIREAVQLGKVEVIGETQIQSAWAALKDSTNDEYELQGYFANTADVVSMADEATREKDPQLLWTFVTACGLQSWQRSDKSYQDAMSFPDAPRDGSFALRDHVPDAVINIHARDRHYAVALEMELTTKTVNDYIRTLAAFQSNLGLAQYQQVIWLYDKTTTGTYLKRALEIVGNRNDQITLQRISTKDASGMRVWSGADVRILTDGAEVAEAPQAASTVRPREQSQKSETEPLNPFAALLRGDDDDD
jgi:hypothetical protein